MGLLVLIRRTTVAVTRVLVRECSGEQLVATQQRQVLLFFVFLLRVGVRAFFLFLINGINLSFLLFENVSSRV